MRDLTARAYMVSRLDHNQLRLLHEREIALGYHGTPSMIRKKFQLAEIGEVPEEMFTSAESQVIAVNEKIRAEYREDHTGCCFKSKDGMYEKDDEQCSPLPDLVVLHSADKKIRHDGIVFPSSPSKGGSLKNRVEVNF